MKRGVVSLTLACAMQLLATSVVASRSTSNSKFNFNFNARAGASVHVGSQGTLDVDANKWGYFSVDDFGAVGDGTTDDTAAFQAALTQVCRQQQMEYGQWKRTLECNCIFG